MHQGNHRDHEGAKKLFALIQDVKVAMMTTADQDGKLYSRPMWCQEADENGDLWFFTKLHSPKTAEISKDNQINLAYSDPSNQTYVSIAGKAEIVTDQAVIDDKWSESLKTWFPNGKDDPEVALLRVHPEKGEYWDSPNATMLHIYGYVRRSTSPEAQARVWAGAACRGARRPLRLGGPAWGRARVPRRNRLTVVRRPRRCRVPAGSGASQKTSVPWDACVLSSEGRAAHRRRPQFARATSTKLSEKDGAWPMSVKACDEMLFTVPSLSWRQ
jgi:general stress protein 26